MLIVNIAEARKRLSRLVDQAAKGEPFVIARAGKPLVQVAALNAPPARFASAPRLRPARPSMGFLAGEISVPEDFNTMGSAAIETLFGPAPDA